jgi:hypothetical protein
MRTWKTLKGDPVSVPGDSKPLSEWQLNAEIIFPFSKK